MKIAYLILAHKEPQQLARLADRLSKTGDVYIHIDKNQNFNDFALVLKDMPRVYLESKRNRVSWAGWSIVKSYIQLLSVAYNDKKNYDRFVFLTGQDYPLMTNSEILLEFENNVNIE